MEYQSITQVAALAAIPETTARRYAANFAKYIDSKHFGRVTKYKLPETVALMRRVFALYQVGNTSQEIEPIIAGEFSSTVEAVTPEKPEFSVPTTLPPQAPQLINTEFVGFLQMQAQTMERIATAIEQMAATQAQEMAAIKDKQYQLEKALEEKSFMVGAPRTSRQQEKPSWKRGGVIFMIALVVITVASGIAAYAYQLGYIKL